MGRRLALRPAAEWWGRLPHGNRMRVVAAALAAVALTAAYGVQEHRTPGRPIQALPTTGPAAELTALQLGHHPGPQNAMLRRIDSLLELLEADCPADTRRRLERLTLRSIRELRAAGLAAAPNGVLGGVVGSQTIGSTQDCAVFFRRFVAKEKGA